MVPDNTASSNISHVKRLSASEPGNNSSKRVCPSTAETTESRHRRTTFGPVRSGTRDLGKQPGMAVQYSSTNDKISLMQETQKKQLEASRDVEVSREVHRKMEIPLGCVLRPSPADNLNNTTDDDMTDSEIIADTCIPEVRTDHRVSDPVSSSTEPKTSSGNDDLRSKARPSETAANSSTGDPLFVMKDVVKCETLVCHPGARVTSITSTSGEEKTTLEVHPRKVPGKWEIEIMVRTVIRYGEVSTSTTSTVTPVPHGTLGMTKEMDRGRMEDARQDTRLR